MTDIHTHILPGVDDGPSDMEESLKIIEKGMKAGIKTFVLTPHIRDDSDWNKIDRIKEAFSLLKRECAVRGLDAQLVLGAELFLIPSLPEKIMDNTSVIINGKGRYVLIELPFSQMPIYTEDVLFKLMMIKIVPIIAHPERYAYINGGSEILKKWVDNGIMLQVNTGSLNGRYGIRAKRSAKRLLKNGLVHLLGSDVHSLDENPSFSKALEIVSRIIGKDKTVQIDETFPAMVANAGESRDMEKRNNV